jgi:UDP-N-acetylglucosamine/UDP-N-acetylgalactosamine diphosphorylase
MSTVDASLRQRCCAAGQSHLLAHWDRLLPSEQGVLAQQIQTLDFEHLARLVSGHEEAVDWVAMASRAEPPEAVRLGEDYRGFSEADARRVGGEAIAAGQVAMILVAGGQGTRLGFDLPKGMFSIGPVSGRTLFEMHVDSLRGAMKRFGVSIPLYVMTGPSTDGPTRSYFAEHGNLGLREDELFVFEQGTMPALDAVTGHVLMETPSRLALSPDGHGGIVAALEKSGGFAAAKARGIRHFFYAQVDNPLVRACDPMLIGFHLLSQSQVTTQVVRKRFAKERVGNVVRIDGKTQIIEYSDLPDAAAEQLLPDGSLRLWAGNIAVHVFDAEFLERSCSQTAGLPFHRAVKAVPYCDAEGLFHRPAAPNAIKLERFVFDLLPMADRTLVVEGDAATVFAPVKNADGGATDTPSTSKAALSELHSQWLREAGVKIRPGVHVEIHPLWAWDGEEVRTKITRPGELECDTYFA